MEVLVRTCPVPGTAAPQPRQALLWNKAFSPLFPCLPLLGTKKVQQDLAAPGSLERFVADPRDAALLRDFFAGLWALDDLSHPDTQQVSCRSRCRCASRCGVCVGAETGLWGLSNLGTHRRTAGAVAGAEAVVPPDASLGFSCGRHGSRRGCGWWNTMPRSTWRGRVPRQ